MPPFLCKRNNVIVAMTSVIVFPLCLLKSLDALKYTSILGLLGTIYCGAFMAFRFFQGSYAEGGKYFGTIAETMRPSFDMRTEKAVIAL